MISPAKAPEKKGIFANFLHGKKTTGLETSNNDMAHNTEKEHLFEANAVARPSFGYFFNVTSYSKKPLLDIYRSIQRVLNENALEYKLFNNIYKVADSFSKPNHTFEIEVSPDANIDLEKNAHGFCIHFVRTHGSLWHHKRLANKLVEEMQL